MYTALYIFFLVISILIAYNGIKKNNKRTVVLGLALLILSLLFFWFLNFWGEELWFDEIGYKERFWTIWIAKLSLSAGGMIFGLLLVYLLTLNLSWHKYTLRSIAILVGGVAGGVWGINAWETVLKFIHQVNTGIQEPILGLDAGFYLFSLPLYKAIYMLVLILSALALVTSIVVNIQISDYKNTFQFNNFLSAYDSFYISTGVVLFVLAAGFYLNRFELLFSEYGIVSGPGWTDDHIRLPALLIAAIVTALFGVIIIIPSLRQKLQSFYNRRFNISHFQSVLMTIGVLIVAWVVLLFLVPVFFQWLNVSPNEITLERPYIENNIKFTRQGFHLNKIEEKKFPVNEEFTREMANNNQELFSNIRLWDYRALDDVFKQFQEIRLYYEFADVDIDRYMIDSAYHQVMISAREMQANNLPLQSQTFINKKFKYTHGYGVALTRVNEFTSSGLPKMLVKDIPPKSEYPGLEVKRPELYYGQLTNEYVIANSKEKEFDYPSGENNIYTNYEGKGGVPITNFWRKFLYGWKFGGTKLLFSGYLSRESRIMFHREISDRVKTIAPFLHFDDDPYVVLADGELYWIIDAYTTSSKYPYSEPFSSFESFSNDNGTSVRNIYAREGTYLRGKNYIRNSVKVVVNAYSGQTDFYIFEEDDPLIQVYNKIFPGLFKSKSDMPENLRKHVRYPSDMLLIQGLVYGKYHMTDPAVFYNQEDLWVRATEKYYSNVQPVEPYYIMWEPPGSNEMQFVLILPFTPKDKQVMIGWIAGMCDGDNYGRFLAYQFSKEERILGTQQVETKIDQDSYLSGQLTLWDQRGSNVIRGNVLAIPVDNTILYVEPIYLKSETAAYPELRLVVLMHNDELSYGKSFSSALDGLLAKSEKGIAAELVGVKGPNLRELIDQANKAFENYLNHMQQKEFEAAGKSLNDLENALQQLKEQDEGMTQNEPF